MRDNAMADVFTRRKEQRAVRSLRSSLRTFTSTSKGNDVVAAPAINTPNITMISSNAVDGRLEYLHVDRLNVDLTYQRRVNPNRVKKIVKVFDPEIFGVITVSRRRDGSLWILDGQHRIEALREMGRHSETVPCLVYEGLILEDEAKIFYMPQTTRVSLKVGERFRARLERHDPVAMRIQEIVEDHGFRINLDDGETSGGRLCAVAAIERVHDSFKPDTLPATLDIIRGAWGGETAGVTAALIVGIAQFHTRYRGIYNKTHLTERLQRATTPHRIEADGVALTKLIGGKREDGVGMTLLRLYNHKLQSRRLPEWNAVMVKGKSKANDA